VVVRTQRIKFGGLGKALRHRSKGLGDPDKVVELVKSHLRSWETLFGKKNLRKNASLVEFVISYETDKAEWEMIDDLERFLRIVSDITGIEVGDLKEIQPGLFLGKNLAVFFHKKNERSHMHVLIVPRRSDGKKVNLKPAMFRQILEKFLPREVLEKVKRTGKRIGAYPLWVYRELERRHGEEWAKRFLKKCRQFRIPTPRLVFVVNRRREKELEEELKRLEEILKKEEKQRRLRNERDNFRAPGL
jgi:hypothetical protein